MKYSRTAREIYARYTDLIEPYGMDENWLMLPAAGYSSAEQIAEKIRQSIKSEFALRYQSVCLSIRCLPSSAPI